MGGSGAPALAKSLHGSRGCLVPEPLKGMERASMEAQLDHLRSLLLEPAYCALEMHLDVGKLAVHGFAVELAPTTAHAKVLNTREGVRALIDLVSTTASRVVVVRRCNTIAWAAQLLLLPQPCDDTGACADRDKVETLRPLPPARLVAKLAECRENEASLRSLMATVQLPQLSINFETTLQFQNEQRVQSMQQLSAFFACL